MIYVILDTNVVVSAMLSRLRSDATTAKTLEYVFLEKWSLSITMRSLMNTSKS